jgi:hypothetical protein
MRVFQSGRQWAWRCLGCGSAFKLNAPEGVRPLGKESPWRRGKAPVAHYRLSYADFAFGFIFPCAQRCFSSRDIFLRAAALILRTGLDAWACFTFAHRACWAAATLARPAALMRPRLRGIAAALEGRPNLWPPVELTAPSAEMAWSIRSRSARSSARILLMSMMAPRTDILTAHVRG